MSALSYSTVLPVATPTTVVLLAIYSETELLSPLVPYIHHNYETWLMIVDPVPYNFNKVNMPCFTDRR